MIRKAVYKAAEAVLGAVTDDTKLYGSDELDSLAFIGLLAGVTIELGSGGIVVDLAKPDNFLREDKPFATVGSLIKHITEIIYGKAVDISNKKLIVVDLDNTLWDGILSENTTVIPNKELQRKLLGLQRAGYLLAVCSKNYEKVATNGITNVPGMVLGMEDFVAWRINWEDKAANIRDIAKELNLGLDSVVFIDDSDYECSRVRGALPMVQVLQWPFDVDTLTYTREVTEEDKHRTEYYRQEHGRKIAQEAQSYEQWLEGLGIKLVMSTLNGRNIDRALELLNRVNQFNFMTYRYDKDELLYVKDQDKTGIYTFSAEDRFGDMGMIGVVIAERGTIRDFVMSCRAFGRRFENAMMDLVAAPFAKFKATGRNMPARDFLESNYERYANAIHVDYYNIEPIGGYDHMEVVREV